ncbi:MAG: hypothetical protein HFH23_14900 [Ruminococcus sp.]|nr:hypothetical protein [Ruminococcus sp.]
MTNKEYLESIEGLHINNAKVSKIESLYGTEMSEIIKRIISNNDRTIFLEECRVLSYDEIVDAEVDLHVDFKGKQILPLFDCWDNDFMVYHYGTGKWSLSNIVDECVFEMRDSLAELLE